MATQKTCDLCGKEAVDTVKAGGTTLTERVIDVCEEHLAEFKKLLRVFSGQDDD